MNNDLVVRKRSLATRKMLDILEDNLYRRGFKYDHNNIQRFFLGLYLNKELIGCAYVDEGDTYLNGKDANESAEIISFVIDKKYQKQGYGKYFAEYIIDKFKRVRLDPIDTSIEFWKSLKFNYCEIYRQMINYEYNEVIS